MDAYGHVNNVVHLRYLEEARIDFMFRLAGEAADASPTDPAPFKAGCVVARHEIDYLRPLFHRYEPVTVDIWVTKLNAASATLAYEIKDAATVYVRAETVIVPYDLEKEHPRRLTPGERAFLEDYFDDSAAAPRIR
ncbi:thioesterase [Streptomyces abyssalis]|uniref:Thioesterase n=2 Tax=Streptomyces abyssalis TaxID=933944 RepID=A0A1E7JJQ5_9ACTN|nr:thioesterase family protein [Streptomyces abyssalis]OEU87346.1 thioesterase [Streptomyces abyssalis]OEU87877.1 thioesterase [Streptomyces abyssalis]OEV29524.1 thioesterase [Streptomyces nanshensis]